MFSLLDYIHTGWKITAHGMQSKVKVFYNQSD